MKGITVAIHPHHRRILADSAITDDALESSGIKSTDTGLDFPWTDGLGPVVWQHRPDNPRTDDDGRPMKYVFPKGAQVPLNRLRDGDTYERLIIAEGTKQQYAVLSHAPADFAVYGMSGCWGWKHADLTVVHERDVFLLLDADFTANVAVYAAAEEFSKQLVRHGARSVRFVSTTGTGKEGVDDVLARLAEDKRAGMLRLWLSQATEKLGKRPKAEQPTEAASKYFRTRSAPIALQPADAADDLLAQFPGALTPEDNIAIYSNGVYRVDGNAILSQIVSMFGNYYTPSIKNTVTDVLKGRLVAAGLELPDHSPDPLLNCPNGMLDLRTGELRPHDPKYLSTTQITVAYDPDAECPLYDAWLRNALRREGATDDEVEALVSDLEEAAGTMLDPSRTPSKAIFLFGKSRTGKSTFLRLLKAVAGAPNTSAVTLHDLTGDQFARANLYGKMLNVAADLSSKHVEDLSVFKMLLGEDVVNANRKYGKQFPFTNRALVAFSANELPTVSEASSAYVERMRPFEFPNSFAGREDKTLEPKLMDELPGILARWVRAYRRILERGGYGPQDQATQILFGVKSDRVFQFVQDMCDINPAVYGQTMDPSLCTIRRDVVFAFNQWAERNGGSKMGERALFARLANIDGVTLVRRGKKAQAFNLVVHTQDDDNWGDDEPVADPVPASGVVVDEGNPWVATEGLEDLVEAPDVPRLVPEADGSVNGPEAAVHAFALTASGQPDDDPAASLFGGVSLDYDF